MATMTVRIKDREGHFRYTPLNEGVSVMEAARCECGAEWRHSDDDTILFCDFAYTHKAPKILTVTVRCTGGFIRGEAVDGNHVAYCPSCLHYRLTHPLEGYDGWHEFDQHVALKAVTP